MINRHSEISFSKKYFLLICLAVPLKTGSNFGIPLLNLSPVLWVTH